MLPSLITSIPGPQSQRLAQRLHAVECRNTTLVERDWPVFWERAEGVNVWDSDGNRLLDLTSAFGVATLGHGFASRALRDQSEQLLHAMGDVHPARLKVELCERLSAMTFETWTGGRGKSLLGNSGFEAVEAALKTAALATGRTGIVAFEGAYHGLGYGALLGAGIPWFRKPFDGQLAQVTSLLPFPRRGDDASLTKFRQALATVDPRRISAVLVEPIQGRGGIVIPPEPFLAELREWCDRHDALLIFDEIFTGLHRTGERFACDHWGVIPDLLC
ncbi:MAG TPA: aminotransferase class III-fold pyridoxal phosphate-dependent enzyme, partial [Luteolibacter sp.]